MTTSSPETSADPPDAGAELVARAREGDLDAFNALVDEHERAVYNLCLRMVGTPAAAEDGTQEAFFAAWRAIGTFRGANFRAWLLRIAANACTDELRRRARRPAVSLDAPAPGATAPVEPPDPAPGPESAALRSEQHARMQAALLRLPADQRFAVVMCDIHGYAYEEIAAAAAVSLGTVKSRIARGREKLRALLAGEREQTGGRERL